MKILMVAAELAPVATVGGVGQYMLGLALALRERGHDLRIAIPAYGFIVAKGGVRDVGGVPVLLLGGHPHFDGVTSAAKIHSATNFEPWVEFSRAVVEHLQTADWCPDVIHCQDSHTALIPVFVSQLREVNGGGFASRVGTVLTIHNLLDQGKGPRSLFDYTGLPDDLFQSHFEFYGDTNCFKAGLQTADRVTTVSRTYAEEIQTSEEFGFGLGGVLRALPIKPKGIVNGIDETIWRMQGLKYDGGDDVETLIAAKQSARAGLIPHWASDNSEPIIAFKGRWDRQKGIELMPEALEQILDCARVIFDTWGEPRKDGAIWAGSHVDVWLRLLQLRDQYPTRLVINLPGTTGPEQTPALYTIADFFLMPSLYEPCGLAQMECQRFGCIPIVRKTGGLADTVIDRHGDPTSNGFEFIVAKPESLVHAVKRAVEAFHSPDKMKRLISSVLTQRNSWATRVEQYEAVYSGVLRPAAHPSRIVNGPAGAP